MHRETLDTLVIGAGISGLAYAHLRSRGEELLVLEAAERAGGLIRTVRIEAPVPLTIEHGPEALAWEGGELAPLVTELGLELRPAQRQASKRFVVSGGRLREVPLSPPRLLTSGLLSWRAKLRLFSEPRRDPGVALEGSIADFARHRLGPEVLERLIDPLVSGIHAGDPEQLSLRACFPEVARMLEEHGSLFASLRARRASGAGRGPPRGPAGGMESLSAALARSLGGRLRLGTRVVALARAGERWRATAEDGEFDARTVVLALPLRETERLLGDAAPDAARALGSMESESLVGVAHAYRRSDVEHPLDGFGYLVPARERSRELGTLFSSSIAPDCAPPDVVLLRSLLGGARHPELVDEPDEELLTLVHRAVGPRLSITGPPLWWSVVRHERVLPRFDLEHPARLRALEAALPDRLHVLGNFTRGLGIGSLVQAARELAASP